MRQYKFNKILAFILVMMMVVTMIPTHIFPQALADDGTTANTGSNPPKDDVKGDEDDNGNTDLEDFFWDILKYMYLPEVDATGLPEGASADIEVVDNPFMTKRGVKSGSKGGSIDTSKFLDFYDIKALDADGNEIHPEGEVEVTITNARIKKNQSVYLIHVLDNEDVIRNADNITLISDRSFVRAFPDAAEAAEKALGQSGVVAIEYIYDIAQDGRNLTFKTSSFSIFIVTEDPRLVVNFYNGEKSDDNLIASIKVKKSDVAANTTLEAVVYDPGVNLGNTSSMIFRGWIGSDPGNAYTADDADNALTIADIRTLIRNKLNNETIEDLQEMDFFAMIFRRFTVTYLDKAGVVSLGRDFVLFRESDNASEQGIDYQINMLYVPDTQDEDWKGWEPIVDETAYPGNTGNIVRSYDQNYQGDTPPDSSITYTNGYNGEVYVNPSWIRIKGDLYVKAYSPSGYWLSFQQNGKGASYTPPQFIEAADPSAVTVEPDDPARLGYDFVGWYEAAGYETVTIEGKEVLQPIKDDKGNVILSDTAFVFGTKITQRTTLYAKWTPHETAGYTVIIWKERMSDTYAQNGGTGEGKEKNYDFAESFSFDGNTGDRVSTVVRSTNSYVTDGDQAGTRYYNAVVDGTTISGKRAKADYTGFHCASIDEDVIIVPEGTSVVNVYYDRNIVTYTFYTYSNDGGFVVATDETEPQWGIVNGEYKEIRKESRDVTVWTPAYTYTRVVATNNEGTQYALIDGEYVELRKESEETTTYRWQFSRSTVFGNNDYWMDESSEDGIFYIRSGNSYAASGYTVNNPPPTDNGVTYYAYYEGFWSSDYYQLTPIATTVYTYTWYNGDEVYVGNRYKRETGGSEYTGKRYLLENGTYTETTGEDGTQYLIDVYGGHVQLNKGTQTRTVWVIPVFEAHYEIDNTNGEYALVGEEYVKLDPIYEYTYTPTGDTYTRSTDDNDNNPTKYGIVNGNIQQIYYRNNNFRLTDDRNGTVYNGYRYTRAVTTDNNPYTDTLYTTISNTAGTNQSGFTEGGSVNLFGKGNGDVYFQLETTATIVGYALNGEPYSGDKYSVSYVDTGEKEIYYGPRYKETTGSGWHIYQANIGLYGETLPWPETTEYLWREEHNNTTGTGTVMTYKSAFLPLNEDMTVEYWASASSGSATITFYTQDIDNTSSYTARFSLKTNGGNFSINDKFTGFYAAQYRVNGGNWQNVGSLNPSTGIYGSEVNYSSSLDIRYNRITGTITFMDGKYFDGNGVGTGETPQGNAFKTSQTYYYEADVSTYNENGADYYTPTTPVAGYVFAGWYADDACTHVYDFTTMPAGGITVYAKWVRVQYRVFLHPGVPTTDVSLEWGDNTQAMTFRIEYGEKISGGQTIMGERDLYELVGWYYDPDFKKPFNFDAYELNDTTVKDAYDKENTYTDYMGRHGIAGWWDETDMVNYADDLNPSNGTAPSLGTTINKDATKNRFWITRVLNLYAKWKHKIEGADGIYLEYDAGEGSFISGTVLKDNGTFSDNVLYDDSAHSYGIAATVPPTGKYFRYWSVQKWIDGKYVDTGDVVYPGEMFSIDYTLARQERIENPVDEDHTYNYYMRLKAVYTDAIPSTTTVEYDPNGGTWEGTAAEQSFTVLVNEEFTLADSSKVERTGYTFLGWAFTADATDPVFTAEQVDQDGGFSVAADNLNLGNGNDYTDDNQNTLYAVWGYTIKVDKVIELPAVEDGVDYSFITLTDALKNKEFTVTPNISRTTIAGYNTAFTIKDTSDPVEFSVFHPQDTFTMTETADPMFTTTYTLTYPDGTTQTISAGATVTVTDNVTVTITNKLNINYLTLKKTVTNTTKDNDKTFYFDVTVDGTTVQDFAVTSGNEAGIVIAIPYGADVTVHEDLEKVTNYENGKSQAAIFVAPADQSIDDMTTDKILTFNNTRKTVKVAVKKIVANSVDPADLAYAFGFTINGQSRTAVHNQDPQASDYVDVEIGSAIVVVETTVNNTDNYSTSYIIGNVQTSYTGRTANIAGVYEDTVITFTNERPAVWLTINKAFVSDKTESGDIKFKVKVNGVELSNPVTLTAANNYTATIGLSDAQGFEYGSTVVVEEITTGYVYEGTLTVGEVFNTEGAKTIELMRADGSVTFTNTRNTVKVVKEFTGSNVADDDKVKFPVHIAYTAPDGSSKTLDVELKNGDEAEVYIKTGTTVTVTEPDLDSNFKAPVITTSADGKTITVKNERDTVTVEVNKTVNGSDSDKGTTFNFTATATLNGKAVTLAEGDAAFTLTGETGSNKHTITLPKGAILTVEEASNADFYTTVDGTAGYQKKITDPILDSTTKIAYVNHAYRKVYVEKVFNSNVADDDQIDFTINVAYKDETGADKTTPVTLKAGETSTDPILVLYGNSVTISESVDGKYFQTPSGTGTFTVTTDSVNVAKTYTVTNARKTIDVTVSKEVVGPTKDGGFAFNASATLNGKAVTLDTGDASFSLDGVTEGKIKNVITLPVGAILTVSETADSGYNAYLPGSTAVATPDANGKVTYTTTAALSEDASITFKNVKLVTITFEKVIVNKGITLPTFAAYYVTYAGGDADTVKLDPVTVSGVTKYFGTVTVEYGTELNTFAEKTDTKDTANKWTVADVFTYVFDKTSVNGKSDETVTLTNTVKDYTVTVTKKTDDDTKDDFNVELTITNGDANGQVKNGTISVVDGETTTAATFSLPFGTTFKLKEVLDDDQPYSIENAEYVIQGENSGLSVSNSVYTVNGAGEIKIFNYRKPVNLTITKNVKSDLNADFREYKFDVYVYDADNSSWTYDRTVSVTVPGPASGSNESTKTSDVFTIPYGKLVKIVEKDADTAAFTITSACGSVKGNDTIEIGKLENTDYAVTYNNTRKTVTLDVTKLISNFSSAAAEFPVDITATYPDGASTQTVYSQPFNFTASANTSGTITLPYGVKVVVAEDGTGTVKINDTDYAISEVFDTTVAINENGTAGTASDSNRTYTIDALTANTGVTFTNTRKNVEVTLTKSLDNAGLEDAWNTYAFKVNYTVTDDCAETAIADGNKTIVPGNTTNTITVPYGAIVAATEDGTGKYENGTHTVAETFTISYSDNNGAAFIADGEIQTKNVRKTVTVDVEKVLESPDANDPEKGTTFAFTVNGQAITAKPASNSSGAIIVPIFTDVTVAETTQLDGFTTQYKVGADGTYTDGSSFTISDIAASTKVYFKNTRTENDVEVVKVVDNKGVNDAWSDGSKTYVMNFEITRPDGTTYTSGSVTGVAPNATTGQTVSVPYGYKITFTEPDAGNKLDGTHAVSEVFDIAITNNNDDAAITGTGVKYTVTNTRKLVKIYVKKVVDSSVANDPLLTATYNFGVEGVGLTDATLSATGNGDKSAEYKEVPIFTQVVVTEQNKPDGFTTTYVVSAGGVSGEGVAATLPSASGTEVVFTFTNARNYFSAVVKKIVNNLGVQDKYSNGEYDYKINYTIHDGDREFVSGSIEVDPTGNGTTITGIPYGYTLTIEEVAKDADDELFTVFGTPAYTNNDATITDNNSVLTVTNTRNKNDVKVVKTLDNKGASDTNWTFKFDYTVEDAARNIIASGTDVVITANDTTGVLIKDVPYGAIVTVTENTALTGGANNTTIANTFTVTYSDNNGGAVTTNDAVITISNVRNTVTVTVNKEVKSDVEVDYTTRKYTFNLTGDLIAVTGATLNSGKTAAELVINGTAANKKASFTVEIPYGTNLTVAEPTTLDPEFDVFTNGTKDTYSATLTNVIDNAQKVDFINRKNIDITVVKKVESSYDADYTTYPFQVTYKDVDTGATVTVAANVTKAAVTKTADGTFTFTVPYGTSTVQIVEQLGNAASSFSTAVTATGSDGTAGANNQSYSITSVNVDTTVTFTNTRIMQTVTVVKNVDSNLAADKNRDYTFTYGYTYVTVDGTVNVTGETLAVTVTDTGSATISIPKNATNLVITEDEFNTDTNSVVKTTVKVNNADAVEAMSGTVASVVDDTNTVTFTNRRVVYVTVRKILDSLHADNDFSFTLAYTDTDGTAVTKNLTIEDVVAGTQGKAYKPAFEIPYGVEVTVTETTVENYQTFVLVAGVDSASVEAVERTKAITKGTAAAPTEFVFTNHRIVALKITKTVDSEEETPTLEYKFTVDYVYDDLSTTDTESAHQETVTVTVDSDTLKGESAYIYLPYGATGVVITETPVTGYDTTAESETAGTNSGSGYVKNVYSLTNAITAETVVKYTNTRMVEVKVTKELDSEEENASSRVFNYTYTYTGTSHKQATAKPFTVQIGVGSNVAMKGSTVLRVPYGVTLEITEVLTEKEINNEYYIVTADNKAGNVASDVGPIKDNDREVVFSNKRVVKVKIIKVVDDPILDSTNNKYSFTYGYTYQNVAAEPVTVEVTVDTETAKGDTGYIKIPYNAVGFYVKENGVSADDFDTTAASTGISGALGTGENAYTFTLGSNLTMLTDITFTNKRMVNVPVTKIVESSVETDYTDKEYAFTYTWTRGTEGKTDEPLTVTVTATNKSGTATVRIPYGAMITFNETEITEGQGTAAQPVFQTLVNGVETLTTGAVEAVAANVAVDANGNAPAALTFTNKRLYTVTITKTLYNRDVNDSWNSFKFPIDVTLANIVGDTYSGVTGFKIAGGNSETFRVPHGTTVTVAEDISGVTVNGFTGSQIFTTTYTNNGVTVEKDEELVVTNTRNTRKITVNKTVDSKVATDFRAYSFTKETENWGGLAGNGTFTLAPEVINEAVSTGELEIPVGLAFTVTEDTTSDTEKPKFVGMETYVYIGTNSANKVESNTITVAAGLEDAVVNFINVRVTAELTIVKEVDEATDRTFIFEITATDTTSGYSYTNRVVIVGGGQVTLNQLQTGYTYTVTELTGWSYEYDVNSVTASDTLRDPVISKSGGEFTGAVSFYFVEDGTVTFGNEKNDTNWLRDEAYVSNLRFIWEN